MANKQLWSGKEREKETQKQEFLSLPLRHLRLAEEKRRHAERNMVL